MPSFDQIFGQSAPTLPRKRVSFDDIFGAPATPPQDFGAPSFDELKQFAPDEMVFDEEEAAAVAAEPVVQYPEPEPLTLPKPTTGVGLGPAPLDAFGKDEFNQTTIHPTEYQRLSPEGRELANRLAMRDNAGDDMTEAFKRVYDTEGIGNALPVRMGRQAVMGLGGTLKEMAENLSGDDDAALRTRQAMQASSAANQSYDGALPNWIEKAAVGASESLAKAGFFGAAGAATGGSAFAGMMPAFVYDSYNDAFAEAKGAGKTDDEARIYASTSGLLEGTITSAFQSVGMGGLEKGLIRKGLRPLLAAVGSELAEEELIGMGQLAASKLQGVNPALTEKDARQAALDIAAQTLVTMGGLKGVSAITGFLSNPTAKNAQAAGINRTLAPTKADRVRLAELAKNQLDSAATPEAPIVEAPTSPVDALPPETAPESPQVVPTQPDASGEVVVEPEVGVGEQASTELSTIGRQNAPIDPVAVTADEFAAAAIPADEAMAIVQGLRAGDARSKNRGEPSGEPKTGPLVVTKLPVGIFTDEYIQFLRESTNADRVTSYAGQEIDSPIYALPPKVNPGKHGRDRWIASDGGHRLLAAIKRGDQTISALVPPESHKAIVDFLSPPPKKRLGRRIQPVPPPEVSTEASGNGFHLLDSDPSVAPPDAPSADVPPLPEDSGVVQKKVLGKRKATKEGMARMEAAQDALRAVINNPDIVGRDRADRISNGKQLVNFLQAEANNKLDTDYIKGDSVAYTGVTTDDGFREFIFLEGHRAGEYGVTATKAEKDARSAQNQDDWQQQQEGFKRLRESTSLSPPLAEPASDVVSEPAVGVESPWKDATAEDESRWYGTKVRVAPEVRGDEEYAGTVTRVLNGGTIVEVKPEDFDSSFRVNADRVTVDEIVDAGAAKQPAEVPSKPTTTTASEDPIADPYRFSEKLKSQGVGRQEAWSRYIQAWSMRSTPMELDAKDFYRIYDSTVAIPPAAQPESVVEPPKKRLGKKKPAQPAKVQAEVQAETPVSDSEKLTLAGDEAIKAIWETHAFDYQERKGYTDRIKGAVSPEAVQTIADEAASVAKERTAAHREQKAKRDKEDSERLQKRRTEARTTAANAKYWKDLSARSRKLKGKKGEVEVTVKEKDKPDTKATRKAEILTDEMALTYTEEDGDGGKKSYSLTHIPTGLSMASGTQPNLRQLAQLIVDSGFDLKKVKARGESAKELGKIVRAWDDSNLQALPDNLKAAFSGESQPTNVKADLVLDGTDMGAFGGVGLKDSGLVRIKQIASAAPEFAYEPVFTVNDKKQLVYKDGVTYTLDPSLFNLHPSELTEGQTVGINLEDIGLKQLTAGQAVVQSLKNWGFNGVRQKPNGEIVAKWGENPVSVSGTDDKWQVASLGKSDGLTKAATQATQALKKMHFYQETPPVAKKKLGKKKEAEVLGAGKGGPQLQPAPTPRVVQSTPKSQREIITDLAKAFKVPIRFGRLKKKGVAGYFLPVENLIAAAKANDIPIVSHEVGHKIDTTYGLSQNPAIASELDTLGDPATPGSRSSWTKSKSKSYKLGEGMAEFVRHWMIDPDKAKADAPNTYASFEQVLDANKDLGDTMRQAQSDIRLWRTAEPQARLRSQISIGENPNKTRYSVSQLTRDLVDDLHYLKLATEDATLGNPNLPPSKNPYLLARNLRGSYGMAETFIRSGAVKFDSKDVDLGTSLEDALKPVGGRLNDFRDWIVAKRAQELHSQGRETGLVPSDIDAVVKAYDKDADFQRAFKAVKKWNDSVLQYAVDSGLVTKTNAESMRAMNQDYVPFHRLFEIGAGEDPSNESSGQGSGLNPGKPGSLKRLKGSTRNIVDPLETMVKNAYAIITASEKAAISNAVADMAKLPDMGKWVEQVSGPSTESKVGVGKIRDQLEDAGADLSNVDDDLLLTFFRAATHPAHGENTIRVIRDGKPEFYRLNRYLHDTFEALDLDDAGKLVRILSAPAQVLRAGVVLEPTFNIGNAFRDSIGAAVIGKHGALPFETTFRGIAAMLNKPEMVANWAASGGRSSVESNYFDRKKMQKYLAEKISKELTPAERALIVAKSPLTALRWLSSTFEEATRIGEYEVALKDYQKSGMPAGEARRLAAFEARDRQDFAKGGAKTKILRHVAAFWNAQLQANVRLAQAFKERPAQTILKGLAFVTLPKLLEQAINWDDEDYWDRPQWERDLFFLIPIGKDDAGHTKFLRLPTPFELGIIFGTVPGRFLQWAKTEDPGSVADLPQVILKQAVPNPTPQTLMTAFELMPDQGYSVFRDREIVPDSMADMPKDMQWTEQTSALAKKVGKTIGVSPMKIDYAIDSTTGGIGKTVMGRHVPGERFVTRDLATSAQSISDFYDTRSKLKEDAERLKATGEMEGFGPVALPAFEDAGERMGALRNEAKAATDPKEKARLQDEAYQIAKEMVASHKENPQTDEAVKEYATKQAKTAGGHGRPVQKTKKRPGRSTPTKLESDADYQKRLSEWQSKRSAAQAWLSKHSDSPVVKEAVGAVKRKKRLGRKKAASR